MYPLPQMNYFVLLEISKTWRVGEGVLMVKVSRENLGYEEADKAPSLCPRRNCSGSEGRQTWVPILTATYRLCGLKQVVKPSLSPFTHPYNTAGITLIRAVGRTTPNVLISSLLRFTFSHILLCSCNQYVLQSIVHLRSLCFPFLPKGTFKWMVCLRVYGILEENGSAGHKASGAVLR